MNFSLLIPELTALSVLIILLVREIFLGEKNSVKDDTPWLMSIGGGFITLASLFPLYGKIGSGFGGTFILDAFGLFFKTFFTVALLIMFFISREFFKNREEKSGEFLLLLWTSLIGLFFLASANDFLLMFVALETFTLSLYVMAAYLKKNSACIEAGLKYLVMGSLASAFIIYGISLLFVASGSTAFTALRETLNLDPWSKLILLGVLLLIAGLGFKIASVPFQLWVPDVYEGAPTPVVAYLSVASKSAGILLLLRILLTAVDAFHIDRTILFAALSALTLFYGNLGALPQTNLKRLFGYSSISHAAYLLMGLAIDQPLGVTALLYYLMGYALANLACFMIITLVEKSAGNTSIDAFRGLGQRSPFLAGMFFLSLLSLAGVPPLAGFFGKFLILMTVVKGGILWLACLGALFVAVSLYYYLNLVRVMYFESSSNQQMIETPVSAKVLLIFLSAAIIITGIFQAPFYQAVEYAAKSLF